MIDSPDEYKNKKKDKKKNKNKNKIDLNINSNINNIIDCEDNNKNKMEEFNQDEFTKMLSEIFPSKYMNEKVNQLENKKKGKVQKNKNVNKIDYQKEKEKVILEKLNNLENNVENNIENNIIEKKSPKQKKENKKITDNNVENEIVVKEKRNSKVNSTSRNFPPNCIVISLKKPGLGHGKANMGMLKPKKNKKIFKEENEDDSDSSPDYIDNMSEEISYNSSDDNSSDDESELEGIDDLICQEDINDSDEEFLYNENKKLKGEENKERIEIIKNYKGFKNGFKGGNPNNVFSYFRKLPIDKQREMIKEAKNIANTSYQPLPYTVKLVESNIPVHTKAVALRKINQYINSEGMGGESHKLKHWIDGFMEIPFGKYCNLPVNINDGMSECKKFMLNSKKILDDCVYGLNDAKMQIMQMVGQWITNPDSIGTAIAIHGPMGTGKTTLVKDGISKMLNRPFAFLPLGGATDSCYLEGHSYTYEGSIPGKIVDVLTKSKCMNPVIYFDELDKVSEGYKGNEIIGILTHLTDTTQNNEFHDKYYTDVDFDLSKALFIFSYNDDKKINPILKDRMHVIKTNGYDIKEKKIIAKDYLLPTIRNNIKFDIEDIIIDDSILDYIINNYTNKEDGVRNLKRCLEVIHSKLNLFRIMDDTSDLFDKDLASLKIEFPLKLEKEIVDKLIKKTKNDLPPMHMYS